MFARFAFASRTVQLGEQLIRAREDFRDRLVVQHLQLNRQLLV